MRAWARRLKRDVLALWVAARDARTPLLAKLVAGATAAYALSPVDLIPDFIPVLGLVDDLLVVPLGIWLALRLIPGDLMDEYRHAAAELAGRPRSIGGLLAVLAIWIACAALLWLAFAPR